MTGLKKPHTRLRCARLTAMICAAVLAGVVTTSPAAAQLFGSRDDSQANVRINQVEEQMRTLTGQIEQLNFQVRTLQDQIRRMQEDNEYRLQQLEGGRGDGDRSDAGSLRGTSDVAGGLNDTTGYGAASSGTLGQLVENAGSGDAEFGSEGGYIADGAGGPLDLSALARGTGGAFAPTGDDQSPPPGVAALSGDVTAPQAGSGGGDARGDYDASYAMILSGDYSGAESGFRRFLQTHPNDPLAANAQFWLGESHFARQQYREAADAFLKSYTDYPDGTKVTDSLLKLGLSLRGIGQTDAACATFNELLTKYPGAPTSIRAEATAQKQSSGCA